MAVILPEEVGGGAVKDIDFGSISGDGTGASTIGGEGLPAVKPKSGEGDGEGKGEGRWWAVGRRYLAVVEGAAVNPDAVYAALAVEGDAMVIIGFAAGIESGPG